MRRAYAGLWLLLMGCDPTAGLQDTADAALPNEKRYFDGAGSQLVEGPWNRVVVDLDAETLYHVGARRDDDEQPTFHLFGADAREGCEVKPNRGTWLMGKPKLAPYRLLPYLEEMNEEGRGKLRFTSLDCQVEDLIVEGAGKPYPRLFDRGYLVPVGTGYRFVDPWAGESRTIAGELRSALVWEDVMLLWADGKLKSFSGQLEPGFEWGSEVEAVVGSGSVFFAEDADGLHRVEFDRETLSLSAEPLLADACHLQHSGMQSVDDTGVWVALEMPCGNAKPTVAHLDTQTGEVTESFEMPFEADARSARVMVGFPSEVGEPGLIHLAYLEDETDGLGTLWLYRMGDEAPIRIGERADLDSVFFQLPTDEWNGAAYLNYRDLGGVEAYDWVRFKWDGSVATVAEGIVRNRATGEMLINFDGVAGDMPRFNEDGVDVWLEDVPVNQGESTSYGDDRRYARIDEFDGTTGQLRLGRELGDASGWKTLGSGVAPESLRFTWFMPALLFLEDFSAKTGTGTLVAYNYDLEARAKIAEGVSSFDLTSYPWDGVIYTVPRGKKSGLWFSKAK